MRKQKWLNLGPKMPYWVFLTKNALFGYFWARILIKLLWDLKSAPLNLSNCKISQKHKNAEIWDQEGLIWVLLCWNLKTILSYLKSAPSNWSKCKISWKNKNAYIWDQKCLIWVFLTKMSYFCVFGLVFQKAIVIFEISTLKFV